MGRELKATPEAVGAAFAQLRKDQLEPTFDRIRAITGGSYSTIKPILDDLLAKEKEAEGKPKAEVPLDFAAMGQRVVAEIYAAVDRQAQEKITRVEAQARADVDAARHEVAEARVEIERLEHVTEDLAATVTELQEQRQQALARAESAEATIKAKHEEIQRLAAAVATAQSDARTAQEHAAQAQRRATESEQARLDAQTAHQARMEEQLGRLSNIEKQLEAERTRVQHQTQRADSAEAASQRVEGQRQELQTRLALSDASVATLQRERDDAREETTRAQAAERGARDEVARLQGKLAQSLESHERLLRENLRTTPGEASAQAGETSAESPNAGAPRGSTR